MPRLDKHGLKVRVDEILNRWKAIGVRRPTAPSGVWIGQR